MICFIYKKTLGTRAGYPFQVLAAAPFGRPRCGLSTTIPGAAGAVGSLFYEQVLRAENLEMHRTSRWFVGTRTKAPNCVNP